jgi:hypothetical protein
MQTTVLIVLTTFSKSSMLPNIGHDHILNVRYLLLGLSECFK